MKLRASLSCLLLLAAASQSLAQDCPQDSLFESVNRAMAVKIQDYVYNSKKSDYDLERTLEFEQPIHSQFHTIAIDVDDPDPRFGEQTCISTPSHGDECERTDCLPIPRVWGNGNCFPFPSQDATKVTNQQREVYTNDGGCNFDGVKKTGVIEKVGKDIIKISYTEDREVQECNKPGRRYVRTDSILYRIREGCLFGTVAQNCDLGPPGSVPCKSCPSGQVRAWLNEEFTKCVGKSITCDLRVMGFRGCSQGYEVTSVKGTTLVCSPCQPHTYNPNWPDDAGSGLRAKCIPCPDYKEAPWYGSEGCKSCPAGLIPTNKRAPLNCKKCPKGTFSSKGDTQCTKCPGGYHSRKEGQRKCTKCPTAWRCLKSTNLGAYSNVPYRWDESGNPACASLDGRTCWKSNPDTSCAAKLKQMSDLIAKKQLKSLVCGAYHKKVWGNDGYGDVAGWCQITKCLLTKPGAPGEGATKCGASAASVDLASADVAIAEKGGGCTCPNCPFNDEELELNPRGPTEDDD